MVSDRSLEVLRVIVQDYVASREPVGSKSIVERHAFGVSAATIRNDMALLEEEELITAPHTSSGRVPTDKGYRVFVDQLADLKPLSQAQRTAIEKFLGEAVDFDDVLARTVRLLAQLTNQMALLQYPTLGRTLVRHVEVVRLSETRLMTVLITDAGQVDQRVLELEAPIDDESVQNLRAAANSALHDLRLAQAGPALAGLADAVPAADRAAAERVAEALQLQVAENRRDRLVVAGAANLVRDAGDFTGSVFPVLEAIEEQVTLLKLFGEMQLDASGVFVGIGRENAGFGLADTSVLASGYTSSPSGAAKLGILGPLRMDYSGNISAVSAVARYLARLLGQD